jgi:carboxymethylenebutenolidase
MTDQPATTAPLPGAALRAQPVAIAAMDADLRGVLVRPAGRTAPGPAVMVVPEVDGLTADTETAARRLADAGYVALAVDLYAPLGGAPRLRTPEDTLAFTAQLNDNRQVSDLAMAIAWLSALDGVDPERLGLVGFSAGGRYSLLASTEPRALRAVVTFYTRIWPSDVIGGRPIAPGDHVAKFRPPVCSIFGDEDQVVPPEMVDRYRALLTGRPGNEVHVVGGNHLFMNPSRRRRYRPESAERAWALALDFLDRHLSP